MFRTLGNAWKVADIRKKILYTLLMLLIYRVGIVIPAPGVNVAYIAEQVNNFTALGFLNMLSGGGLESMSIFALGISPYLNASIIMNLLTVAIPALERMAKEEENGARKFPPLQGLSPSVWPLFRLWASFLAWAPMRCSPQMHLTISPSCSA